MLDYLLVLIKILIQRSFMSQKLIDKTITGFFVFIFGTLWFFSARTYQKPLQYSLIVYDVLGDEKIINYLRRDFSTKRVARSFIKEYQKQFPQYDFILKDYLPTNCQSYFKKFLKEIFYR